MGTEVFRRRKRLGLSGEALAKLAGVNKGTIVRIERDDKSVKTRTVQLVLSTIIEQERDLLGHGVQASSLRNEGGLHHVDSSRILPVDFAVIDELSAIANRLAIIAAGLDDARERRRRADAQPPELHPASAPKKR